MATWGVRVQGMPGVRSVQSACPLLDAEPKLLLPAESLPLLALVSMLQLLPLSMQPS